MKSTRDGQTIVKSAARLILHAAVQPFRFLFVYSFYVVMRRAFG